MIFVIGPLYAGKQNYICRALGWTAEEFTQNAIRDAHKLAEGDGDLTALADRLAAFPVVVATEMGGGVVPIEPEQRKNRERAGRLACLLAERAETVIRVCCGLPQVLKGPGIEEKSGKENAGRET